MPSRIANCVLQGAKVGYPTLSFLRLLQSRTFTIYEQACGGTVFLPLVSQLFDFCGWVLPSSFIWPMLGRIMSSRLDQLMKLIYIMLAIVYRVINNMLALDHQIHWPFIIMIGCLKINVSLYICCCTVSYMSLPLVQWYLR